MRGERECKREKGKSEMWEERYGKVVSGKPRAGQSVDFKKEQAINQKC